MKHSKTKRADAKPGNATVALPQIVQIEKPIYGGAFLARVEGKAIFVPLTLPGEQVRVRILDEKRGYSVADAEAILTASLERIPSKCRHYGRCGGCHYQHAGYETQLAIKLAILRETFERGGIRMPVEIAVLSGDPWHYRNRIRLAFDSEGNPGYRGRRSHAVVQIDECPIAAPLLIEAAMAASQIARQFAAAWRPTEISLFCNRDETALLASVFTSSKSKTPFDEFTLALRKRIPSLVGSQLVSEDGEGSSRTLANWGASSLAYRTNQFDYRVDQGAFFQVNRWLVDELLEKVVFGRSGALAWDLFAGVGLFARRLTENFARVVAVESAPTAIAALQHNLQDTNGSGLNAETVAFLRRHCKAERPDLIVLDPPRTGLGQETTALLSEIAAPGVVYVSCDPATLARDLRDLVGSGYRIESITLVDLFPQTFHLETVVHLHRS